MRRLLIVLGVVALCSVAWADSVEYDVNAWATFTAAATGATETIGVNFLYLPNYAGGTMVPGSLDVSSSGFMGTFSPYSNCSTCGFYGYYMGLFNHQGDEIDLDWNSNQITGDAILPGTNTVDFDQWSCQSAACVSAEGGSWIGPDGGGVGPFGGVSEGSKVTAVAVPDGTSFLWLSLSAFASVGLAWRWRRRPEQIVAH